MIDDVKADKNQLKNRHDEAKHRTKGIQ